MHRKDRSQVHVTQPHLLHRSQHSMVGQIGGGGDLRKEGIHLPLFSDLFIPTLYFSPNGVLLVLVHPGHHHIPALAELSTFLKIVKTLSPQHRHYVTQNMLRQLLPISRSRISRSRRHFDIFDEGLFVCPDLSESHDSRPVSLGLLDSSDGGLPGSLGGQLLPGSVVLIGLGLLSSCHGERSDDTYVRGREILGFIEVPMNLSNIIN